MGFFKIVKFLKKLPKRLVLHALFEGPSGTGKGSLVNRLAADLEWPVIYQDCSEIG